MAEIAQDREVGISAAGKTYFGRSARVPAATAREHSRKGLLSKGEDDSLRLARGNSRRAVRWWRLSEELAMSEVTKIKVTVTPSSGQEVGTRNDCLSLQGFGRSIRVGLSRDSGGDRSFQIHGDDGKHFSARGFYDKSAAISTRDLSVNSKKKRDCAIVAGGCTELRGTKNMAAQIEEKRVIRNTNSSHTRAWLENECLARGVNDERLIARGLQLDFARMKKTEDTDAHTLGECVWIQDQSEEQKNDGPARHAANPPSGGACGLR